MINVAKIQSAEKQIEPVTSALGLSLTPQFQGRRVMSCGFAGTWKVVLLPSPKVILGWEGIPQMGGLRGWVVVLCSFLLFLLPVIYFIFLVF